MATSRSRSDLPHIIVFNPDQWRGDVMGHIGNPAAVTPNLDRLVREDAVSFRNAFCQNTVCTPSRCSFMTGWYPHVRGHRTMHHMLHPERDERHLLSILRDAGYFVWWGGKNDLVPGQVGFADCCDVKFQSDEADFRRWGHRSRSQWGGDESWRGEPGSDSYYSFYAGKLDKGDDDLFCDRDWSNVLGAVDLIRSYDGERPLFIYLPLIYPHPPYAVEEPWFSMIDRGRLPARIAAPEGSAGKPSILEGIRRNQGLQSWTEERWTELRAVYCGMCARVDHQLGVIVEELKTAGIYDSTNLFFFADHGDFTGDYGLVEKTQNTFEDCLSRVPFVIKPATDAGIRKPVDVEARVSDALVELVDFPATVFDLTGIDPGYSHFGCSLTPVLTGQTDEHRDAVFCEGGRLEAEVQAMERESSSHLSPEGMYWPRISLQTSDEAPWHTKASMCRTRTHKYVRRLYEADELYDLTVDPGEVRSVAGDSAYAGVLAEMKDRMLTWYMATCDVVPRETDSR